MYHSNIVSKIIQQKKIPKLFKNYSTKNSKIKKLFKELFKKNNSQILFIFYLKELQAVLNFMYHGEVNVAQDALNGFLAVAEELAVKGLTTDSRPAGGGGGGVTPEEAPGSRKKAVAKRKSAGPIPASQQAAAKKPKSDEEDVEAHDVDVKRIKAEPEPSVSGAGGPVLDAELDDSYGGVDDGGDNGDFGGEGEDFEGFAQYGDEAEFDDSSLGAGGSGATGDGKGRETLFSAQEQRYLVFRIEKLTKS
jgi:hypothetical protein